MSFSIISVFQRLAQLSSSISIATRLRLNCADRIQSYVLAWLVVLIALFSIGPWGGLGWLPAAIACYRLQDLLIGSLDDGFRFTCRSVEFVRPRPHLRAPIAILFVNSLQIIFIFAIAFMNICADGIRLPDGSPATARSDLLYHSWTTLFTVGSGFTVMSGLARAFTMLEVSTGLVLIGIALGTFLSRSQVGSALEAIDSQSLRCARLIGCSSNREVSDCPIIREGRTDGTVA